MGVDHFRMSGISSASITIVWPSVSRAHPMAASSSLETICECDIVGNLLPTFHCQPALPLLPGTAQRCWLGIFWSFVVNSLGAQALLAVWRELLPRTGEQCPND